MDFSPDQAGLPCLQPLPLSEDVALGQSYISTHHISVTILNFHVSFAQFRGSAPWEDAALCNCQITISSHYSTLYVVYALLICSENKQHCLFLWMIKVLSGGGCRGHWQVQTSVAVYKCYMWGGGEGGGGGGGGNNLNIKWVHETQAIALNFVY